MCGTINVTCTGAALWAWVWMLQQESLSCHSLLTGSCALDLRDYLPVGPAIGGCWGWVPCVSKKACRLEAGLLSPCECTTHFACHRQEEEVVQPFLKKQAVPSCTPVNNFSVRAGCIIKQLALEITLNKYVYWNIYSWTEIDTEN